ncbi:SDR family oxidoreductase [bacterium]|nr:MAG: SDR family oxidoreductase [bacterium]
MKLPNKIAIVTGASKGLGASFSKHLCEKDVTVYGIGRSESDLNRLSTEFGSRFIPVILDVSDRNAVENWFSETFNESKLPDILINNAGFGYVSKVEDTPPEVWDSMMAVNVTAVFDFTRLAVPFMKMNPETCHIINVASVAGLIGNPSLTAYNASKFAIRGFSDALMKEVRNDGIKVTCMFPGSIETSFFDQLEMKGSPNKLNPDEIARLVVFLLETSSNFLVDEITLRPLIPS